MDRCERRPRWYYGGHLLNEDYTSTSDSSEDSCCPRTLAEYKWQEPKFLRTSLRNVITMSIESEALSRVFSELKSKNKDIRLKASYSLLSQVIVAHNGKRVESKLILLWYKANRVIELPADKFNEFYGINVHHRLAQLIVSSTDTNDKIGGILALERLLTFDAEDSLQQNKTTRFASYLKSALRSNDNDVLVYAARALGHLATPGGALTAELVDSEIKSALEWLTTSDRQESRRFAAVLVIRELGKNAPTLVYAFVQQILECIWITLRDSKVLIRETAGEAVGVCFEIISARDATLRQQWFTNMWDESLIGLKQANIENVHGSLLAVRELLIRGNMFMKNHYREACEIALRYKDHREAKIRSHIIMMIPVLAGYSPSEFSSTYLHKFMTYLLGQLKKDKERNDAFISIGKVANAVGSAIAPYLDSILVYIREGLSFKA